jgi:primosomal replication protein N
MRIYWNENAGHFVGRVLGEPEFSHENHGEDYFRILLCVRRLSGAEDLLPVVLSRSQLESYPVHAGDRLAVEGGVRSYNNRSGVGSRLVLTVLARTLSPAGEEDANTLTLAGALCKAPSYRRTPLGREICDLTLAVNRRYGRADYLPCISWGALARQCAQMQVGDPLRFRGRFQSRGYTKNLGEQQLHRTAYEVSVMTLEETKADVVAH